MKIHHGCRVVVDHLDIVSLAEIVDYANYGCYPEGWGCVDCLAW
jgi:hypothetical protein